MSGCVCAGGPGLASADSPHSRLTTQTGFSWVKHEQPATGSPEGSHGVRVSRRESKYWNFEFLQSYHMRGLNLCNRPQGIHFCNRNWILTFRLTANQVDRPNIAEIKGGVQIHSFWAETVIFCLQSKYEFYLLFFPPPPLKKSLIPLYHCVRCLKHL